MSEIKALDSLTGTISGISELEATLSTNEMLKGQLSVPKEYDVYAGPYDVIPKAFDSQILETENRAMKKDVTISKVPYWETSNESNGETAYIAEEVFLDGN